MRVLERLFVGVIVVATWATVTIAADPTAVDKFLADVVALAGKPIPALDASGSPRADGSATIRRQGPRDFIFSTKTVRGTGKASMGPAAYSFRPSEAGPSKGSFAVHKLVDDATISCGAMLTTAADTRTLELVCSRPDGSKSRERWSLSTQALEVTFTAASGATTKYRVVR